MKYHGNVTVGVLLLRLRLASIAPACNLGGLVLLPKLVGLGANEAISHPGCRSDYYTDAGGPKPANGDRHSYTQPNPIAGRTIKSAVHRRQHKCPGTTELGERDSRDYC